jgi:hypothetical protein
MDEPQGTCALPPSAHPGMQPGLEHGRQDRYLPGMNRRYSAGQRQVLSGQKAWS